MLELLESFLLIVFMIVFAAFITFIQIKPLSKKEIEKRQMKANKETLDKLIGK